MGEVLKKIRMIYGYKAKEMSTLLEISPSYLSEIENNKKKPSLDILEKYSEIFQIKVSSIIAMSENYNEDLKNNLSINKIMIKLMNYFAALHGDDND
ncbi:helix-turn-helix domain-containing protein [uncultured Clostridium sp.]|uniref:helix-turn-helix domain-containing protein n=1 Tax=uncultured Clostridium sp. TaxID=59620 RepID=UPI0025D8E24D|nr:helix-turn-helix transcriptional regulator [uncultured Clostridium sp.]